MEDFINLLEAVKEFGELNGIDVTIDDVIEVIEYYDKSRISEDEVKKFLTDVYGLY